MGVFVQRKEIEDSN